MVYVPISNLNACDTDSCRFLFDFFADIVLISGFGQKRLLNDCSGSSVNALSPVNLY